MKKHSVGDKQYVPHIVKDGAYYHVLSYFGGNKGAFVKCSEKNCIYNKRYDEVFGNK